MSDLPPPPPPPPPGGGPPGPPGEPGPPGWSGYEVGQVRKAGPWIRFAARLIDSLVLLIPLMVLAVMVLDRDLLEGGDLAALETDGSAMLYNVLATILVVAYFTAFESSKGATIGKRALSLRVESHDGGVPTTEEALRRNAFVALGIVPAVGGVLSLAISIAIAVTIAGDSGGRGLHDRFAGGTQVVRTR